MPEDDIAPVDRERSAFPTVHTTESKPAVQLLSSDRYPKTERSDPGAQVDANLVPHSLFARRSASSNAIAFGAVTEPITWSVC